MNLNSKMTSWRVLALTLVLLLAAGTFAFAGGAKEEPEAAVVAAEAGNEAPQLAALVDRGELPPLAERLPDAPLVIEPHDEIGRYGGTVRSGFGRRR